MQNMPMQSTPQRAVAAENATRNHLNLIVAQRAQAIVDVAIIGSVERFQSAILSVDRDAQTITIDELFPAGFVARAGQRVILTLRLEGDRRESFTSEVINSDEKTGGYLVRLPPSVDYHQRRAAYRVAVPPHWANGGEFFTPGSRRCAGSVRDISPSGIRLEILEWSPLQPGDVLEELHFDLLGTQYQCRASVRNIRVKNSNSIEIGAAFIDLTRQQQRVLERCLMQLQRRQAATVARSRPQ